MQRGIQHYRQKLEQYLSQLPKCAIQELKISDESAYSMTPFNTAFQTAFLADFIMRDILQFKEFEALDLTMCIGGDTFALTFFAKKVEAYEINQETFNAFKDNLKVFERYGFGQYISKIVSFNESSLNYVKSPQQLSLPYFVVLDAPWGGPDYKTRQNLRLKLNDTGIEDIALQALEKAHFVILKIPINYDETYLREQLSSCSLLFYTQNNIKYVYVLKKLLSSTDTQKIQQFTTKISFLSDSFLLSDCQYEIYDRRVSDILGYKLATTKNLRANLRRVMDAARQRNQLLIKVTTRLAAPQRLSSIVQLAAAAAIAFHVPATLCFTDEEQREGAKILVQQLPPFVQLAAGVYPTIYVTDNRVNDPLISIGNNLDQHAYFTFILQGQACNIKFLRGEFATEVFEEVVASYTQFIKYCVSEICKQNYKEEMEKLLHRPEITLKDDVDDNLLTLE